MTRFVVDYFKAVDALALAALVAIACAAFFRNGSWWLLIAALLIVAWGALRTFGWP
jgi:hypothetical protein